MEDDSENLRLDTDLNSKKLKDHTERLDGHATRLKVDSELIHEL